MASEFTARLLPGVGKKGRTSRTGSTINDEDLAKGWALQKAGRFEDALRIYRQIRERAPKNFNAWSMFGTVDLLRGDIPEAVTALQRGIQLCPDRADPQSNLGITYAMQGDFDNAIACFERALQRRSDFAEARDNLEKAIRDRSAV